MATTGTTTTTGTAATTHGTARSARAGLVGGALWVAFPWGTTVISTDGAAEAAYIGLMLVLPGVLLLAAVRGLHALHRRRYGRLGAWGAALTGLALSGMVVGLGWEVTTIALWGQESAPGHVVWMLGFLLLLPASVVLGLAVRGARVLPRARVLGLALTLVIPASVVLAAAGGAVFRGDTGFWLGLTLPYGLLWLGLATSMRATTAESVGTPAPVLA